MMRYRSSRLSALFMAVVFLLIGAGDLFGLHSCPHHDDSAAGHEMPAGEGASHHSAAGHDHGLSMPADEGGHTGGPCICGGSCPAASLAPLPGTSISIVEIFPAAAQPVGIRDIVVARNFFLPFFLPYANAPPLIS